MAWRNNGGGGGGWYGEKKEVLDGANIENYDVRRSQCSVRSVRFVNEAAAMAETKNAAGKYEYATVVVSNKDVDEAEKCIFSYIRDARPSSR